MPTVLVIGASPEFDAQCLSANVQHRGSLDDQRDAQDRLASIVGALDGSDIILTRGLPYAWDRWALEQVLSLRQFHSSTLDLGEYRLDGFLAWASGKEGRAWHTGKPSVIDRDESIATKAIELQRRGYDVRGHFLEASWTARGNVDYLASLMRSNGLPVSLVKVARGQEK